MSKVGVSKIPTVAQLFKSGALKPAAPSSSSLPAYSHLSNRVALWQGDITKLEVDGIVNAANESLLGGGGVDGAIHRAAGPELVKECRTLNGCKTGDAKVTKGYKLPAKHVVHTVGPIYSRSNAGTSRSKLQSAYRRSLEAATEADIKTIAFPSISTGVYGYPIEEATNVSLEVTGEYLADKESSQLELVVFCVFGDADKHVYEQVIPKHFSPQSD
ncbi:A1pp-domain-containing protein [Acaromyces ingoldii]|uniref:A1pp-domain-containing protein n=1 Tax=Acaromyces ingoldii TaxID=215250 RepID=A0A316YS06_9BASI|nr:A1pp-domain-containing protein [Acaromyces ingoldii]PWN90525.1 A1pp-domain-containing protein [Acaromyces ingoldii]